jgi:hypothetical protein
MVTLMTLFSRTYSKYITVNVLATNKGLTTFGRASNYLMYILNIMTNQGNILLEGKIFKNIVITHIIYVPLVDLFNTLRGCNFW